MRRDEYGALEVSPLAAATGLSLLGWLLLAGSLLMDRADDSFYRVPANRLLDYEPVGAILAVLIVLALPLLLWMLRGRGAAAIPLLPLAAIALACAILSAADLGTHAAYGGDLRNEAGAGTVVAIAGATLLAAGAGLAVVRGRGRSPGLTRR